MPARKSWISPLLIEGSYILCQSPAMKVSQIITHSDFHASVVITININREKSMMLQTCKYNLLDLVGDFKLIEM